jgi:WD40 repeat protein
MATPLFRIFVSSPGDVSEERAIAEQVIERLAREWAPALHIEPFLWEHEPLRATSSYQDQIDRLCRPSHADVVVCLLWCRFGTRLPPNITRSGGTPYDSGTEYELEEAAAAYERTGVQPVLLVYKKTTKLLVDIEDARYIDRKRQKDDLETFLRSWTENPDGTAKRAIHRFETAADFEDLLERHLVRLITARAGTLGEKPKAPAAWRGSPFRGLGVFEAEHAPIFFGRTAATSAVIAALRARDARGQAFVAVVGGSGTGKSSLARAGILPLLTTPGVIADVGLWRRGVLVPGERQVGLFEGLAGAIAANDALPELAAGNSTAGSLAATFREAPAAFVATIEGALRQAAAAVQRDRGLQGLPFARLALVVDQMEQLFTLDGVTADARQRFVQCLAAGVRGRHLVVVATLRSDFFQRCQEIPELVELMQGDGQYQLQNPGGAELERIITKPAALAGIDFEPGGDNELSLDARLRDAALEHPHSLPLLEFALEQLYARRTPAGRLTHEAYGAIGELRGAVAKHAEEAFLTWAAAHASTSAARDQDAGTALGALLSTLVTVRADTELVTSRRVDESEIPEGPPRQLANALVAARLLVTDTDQADRPMFTVAHEAVLHEWPRAGQWIARSLEFLRIRARITLDRLRWEESGPAVKQRDRDLLLPEGRRLAEAQELLRTRRPDLEPLTVEFITASISRASRAKRLRWSGYATSALLLIGAAFGLYAFWQSRQIEQQRRLAVVYRLAAQAELTRAEQPGLSALLSIESLARQPSLEGDISLRRSLMLLPELVSEREVSRIEGASSVRGTFVVEHDFEKGYRVVNVVTNVASGWLLKPDAQDALWVPSSTFVTPDGAHLIAVTQNPTQEQDNRRIRFVNIATGAVEVHNPYRERYDYVTLSPDGRYLAAVDKSGIDVWWIGSSRFRDFRAVKWSGPVRRVAFSDDSEHLAVLMVDRVWVFEPTLKVEPREIKMSQISDEVAFRPSHPDEIAIATRDDVCLWRIAPVTSLSCVPQDQHQETRVMAFSPDGLTLAVAGSSGHVRIVNLSTRSQVARFVVDDEPTALVWSPSGSMVAALGAKAIVHVWSVDRSRELARLSDQERLLWFDATSTLTTVSKSPRVQRWTMRDGALEQRLFSHHAQVHDVAFTPDAHAIITGSGHVGTESTDRPDTRVRVWSLDHAVDPVVLPQDQPIGAVRTLADGRHLIAAGGHGITIWDLSDRRQTASLPCKSVLEEIEFTFLSFAWSATSGLLACHTTHEAVQLFRLPDGQPVGKPLTGDAPVFGLAFDDDGKYLAVGRGKTIELWDVGARAVVGRVPMDEEGSLLLFVPHSRRLAVTDQSGMRFLDVEKRAFEALKFDLEQRQVVPNFSPDGRFAALVKDDAVMVWELAKGRQVARLMHPANIRAVAFSPDGAFLATAAHDDVARIWDIGSGRERVRLADIFKRGSDSLQQVAFSADGRWLATRHILDVRLWAWRPDDLSSEACRLVRGNLTPAEWVEYVGAGDTCAATCSAFPACSTPSKDRPGPPPRLLK